MVYNTGNEGESVSLGAGIPGPPGPPGPRGNLLVDILVRQCMYYYLLSVIY